MILRRPEPQALYSWYPISDAQYTAMLCNAQILCYGGSAGSAKALAIDTPIPIVSGWSTMGDLQVGDKLFDERGIICRVLGTSPLMERETFRVRFDDGSYLDACGEHRWKTTSGYTTHASLADASVRTTEEIRRTLVDDSGEFQHYIGNRYIISCESIGMRTVRCIAVSSPSHLFLAGKDFIPTHNSDYLLGDACQERDNRRLRAVLVRTSFPEMSGLMDRAREIYPHMGAWYREGKRTWIFPSGATIRFDYLSADKDIKRVQGNGFTFLGVDESTHQPEHRIRRMLPWLRSTDASLKLRIRLATNPGNEGAAWHKHVFMRGKCPVHFPRQSTLPGVVYKGATWLKDGVEIGKTTCFIPGKVTDHNMLGQEYINNLKTQEAAIAEQLLDGCWCALEGMFFPFLRETPPYYVERAMVEEQWWWTHYLSIDYGFSSSAAACGLYGINEPTSKFPKGQHHLLDEVVERKMGSTEFAEYVCEKMIAPKIGGERRRIVAAYMDPANDSHTDTGLSNLEQMAKIFACYNVPVVKASKDSFANAQALYRMLKNGEMVITDGAPKTFLSLSTRMHDPNRSGCIKKVVGDELDDCCDQILYSANTFIRDTEKPFEVSVEEKIAQMQKAGANLQSMLVQRNKMEREHKKKKAPIRIGGRSHSKKSVVRR